MPICDVVCEMVPYLHDTVELETSLLLASVGSCANVVLGPDLDPGKGLAASWIAFIYYMHSRPLSIYCGVPPL